MNTIDNDRFNNSNETQSSINLLKKERLLLRVRSKVGGTKISDKKQKHSIVSLYTNMKKNSNKI